MTLRKIKVHHVLKPERKYDIEVDMDALSGDRFALTRCDGETFYYGAFMIDDGITYDELYYYNGMDIYVRDMKSLIVKFDDGYGLEEDYIDPYEFSIDRNSGNVYYMGYPLVSTDNTNLYTFGFNFKYTHLISEYGIIPKIIETNDEPITTELETMTIGYDDGDNVTYAGQDIWYIVDFLRYDGSKVYNWLTNQTISTIDNKPINVKKFVKKWSVKNALA